MKSAQAGTQVSKSKSCPKPDDNDGADDDRPSRAENIAATPGGIGSSGAAKLAVKTTPDHDLVQIVERLRNSRGGFTEETNQDCAVLVRRAEQLAGTLHTCRSLSGELFLLALEHLFFLRPVLPAFLVALVPSRTQVTPKNHGSCREKRRCSFITHQNGD
jgi:hypothetical protein